MPLSADYEIAITLQGTDAVPPNPIPVMHVGRTVRYSSDAGQVRIIFPDCSPFREDHQKMTEVPGSMILTLLTATGESTLPCRCFITLPNNTTVGWLADPSPSGGDHKVTKP
jgi:hypothetical protein